MTIVTLEVEGGIATVTITRPPVNAMNRPMYNEILDTFFEIEKRDDINVVVVKSGCEKAFLAGADINERLHANADKGAEKATIADRLDDQRVPRESFWAVYDCAVPVIASVNGAALGAGFAVAACCDIVVASDKAVFGLTELNVGLLGASAFLTRLVGPARMRMAYYTAERMTAAELYRLGGIAMVVESTQLEDATYTLARSIAARSPVAVRLAKASFNRVEAMPLKEAYRTEQDYTMRLRSFGDSKEAMSAFLEHRAPVYDTVTTDDTE